MRDGRGVESSIDMASLLRDPLLLEPNPVHRFYDGGRRSRRFRGLPDTVDDSWSEDWVGSCSVAGNADPAGRLQGLSTVLHGNGQRETLAALLGRYPELLVGPDALRAGGLTTGVLVKLLSPAEAVPVHAHPDRAWASEHLGSPFGKTEAWIVLEVDVPDGVGTAGIGFKPGIDRGRFAEAVRRRDSRYLRRALHSMDVRPGDVLVAPAGVPHYLGPGFSYIEVQEPSDHIVVAETDVDSNEVFCTMGLGWARALDMIDYTPFEPSYAEQHFRQRRVSHRLMPGVHPLISREHLGFFDAWSIDVAPSQPIHLDGGRFSIMVVTAGSGAIRGGSRALPVRRGSTVALPAAAAVDLVAEQKGMRLIRCMGPLAERAALAGTA